MMRMNFPALYNGREFGLAIVLKKIQAPSKICGGTDGVVGKAWLTNSRERREYSHRRIKSDSNTALVPPNKEPRMRRQNIRGLRTSIQWIRVSHFNPTWCSPHHPPISYMPVLHHLRRVLRNQYAPFLGADIVEIYSGSREIFVWGFCTFI